MRVWRGSVICRRTHCQTRIGRREPQCRRAPTPCRGSLFRWVCLGVWAVLRAESGEAWRGGGGSSGDRFPRPESRRGEHYSPEHRHRVSFTARVHCSFTGGVSLPSLPRQGVSCVRDMIASFRWQVLVLCAKHIVGGEDDTHLATVSAAVKTRLYLGPCDPNYTYSTTHTH